MMTKRSVLFFIIALFLLTSCSSRKTVAKQSATPALSAEQKAEFNAFFLEALCMQHAGKYASASELLKAALLIDSTASEAHLTMAEVIDAVRSPRDTAIYQKMMEHLRLATHYSPNTPTYFEKYSSKLLEKGKYEEALPYLERLAELSATSKLYYDLAKTYAKLQRYSEAHKALDHVANMEGEIYPVIEARAQLYEAQADTTQLFDYLEKVVANNPDDSQIFRLLIVNAMEHGRADFAEKEILLRLKDSPQNPDYQIGLYYVYSIYKPDKEDEMWDILQRVANNNLIEENFRAEVLDNLAEHLRTQNKPLDKLYDIFDSAISSPLKSGIIPATYYFLLKKQNATTERILPVLERIIEIEPESETTYRMIIQLCHENNDVEKIIELCHKAQLYMPSELLYYYLEAHYQYEELHADGVIEILERGLKNNKDEDTDLHVDVYNYLADCYFEINESQKAFAYYEKTLAIDSFNVQALNNYAYYLSLRDERLDYAEELAIRMLKAEPNNPTYLDTYAWILFKQEKYTQAQIYIDKTLEHADKEDYESSVLFDHAGDIYLACGEKQKACIHWIKAFELTQDPDERKTIHKKIKRYARPPIKIPQL